MHNVHVHVHVCVVVLFISRAPAEAVPRSRVQLSPTIEQWFTEWPVAAAFTVAAEVAMLGAILFLVMAGEASALDAEDENSLAALERMVKWAALGMDISSVAAAAADDGGGYTMLHEAVAYGHTEAVEALLAAGASVDAKMVGTSTDGVMVTLRPLHLAAGKGDMGPLRALIAAGADLDVTSYNGLTPLHLAARQGHASVVEALAAAGASIEARDTDGNTPLHDATGDAKAIRVLVAAGAALEDKGTDGTTPLHRAAALGNAASIEVLLALGASHSSLDDGGETPLHEAAYKGHVDAIRVLVAAGAPLNAFNHALETPLYVASSEGHMEAVRALVAAGATTSGEFTTGVSGCFDHRDGRRRDCCCVSFPPTCFQNARSGQEAEEPHSCPSPHASREGPGHEATGKKERTRGRDCVWSSEGAQCGSSKATAGHAARRRASRAEGGGACNCSDGSGEGRS